MLELNIHGRGIIQLDHLVCDVNGTLSVDGRLPENLPRILNELRSILTIHLITADTQGKQSIIDQQLGFPAHRLQAGDEDVQKEKLVKQLSAQRVVAIGQGANDAAMLKTAALGICILSVEGAAIESLLAADLVVPDIFSAFELLEKPLRIVATLRK
jgi:P-type E1-E2 ATPase